LTKYCSPTFAVVPRRPNVDFIKYVCVGNICKHRKRLAPKLTRAHSKFDARVYIMTNALWRLDDVRGSLRRRYRQRPASVQPQSCLPGYLQTAGDCRCRGLRLCLIGNRSHGCS